MNRRLAAVLILLGSVLLTGCWGPVSSIGTSSVGNTLTQGQRFTLKDINGNVVVLDQLLTQKKAVLLDFWATWCGYCVEEMPDLIKLQQKQQARGFTVLGVNVGESRDQAAGFAEKMGLNFPIVLDEDSTVAQQYNVVGIPLSLLINSKGDVVGEYHAYTRQLEDDIEKTLE